MTEITRQLRSEPELAALLTEANQSPFIGDIQLSELRVLIKAETIYFLYEDDALAGFSGWTAINTAWDEVGPLFVSERFQGKGFGKLMLLKVVDECEQHGTNLYVVTSNPKVKDILTKRGFEERPSSRLPLAVQFHLLRKLSPRKIMRFLQKRHAEPVIHLVLHVNPKHAS